MDDLCREQQERASTAESTLAAQLLALQAANSAIILLQEDLATQRTALLALAERIRREGMQGVANSIEEIVK